MRRIRPFGVIVGLLLAATVGGLSLAQQPMGPTPGPGPDYYPPVLDAPMLPIPDAEEPPPIAPGAVAGGMAPPPNAPSTITADETEAKEKPAATTPLPEKTPTLLKRPRRNEAIIQALDKVTAQTVRFPAGVNKPVRWKDLVFTVRACEESADDESQGGAYAHIEISSEPKVGPGRTPPPAKQVYRGWMFSEAPAAHPFEHPVYDVWLIACRAA